MKSLFCLLFITIFISCSTSQSEEEIAKINELYMFAAEAADRMDYLSAYEYLKESLELSEGFRIDTAVYYNIGITASEADKNEEAIFYFNKCIDLNYQKASCCSLIVLTIDRMINKERKLEILKKQIEKYPNEQLFTLTLANEFIKNEKFPEALTFINNSLGKGLKTAELYRYKGYVLQMQNNIKRAIEAYTESINLNPDNFDVCYNMGTIYHNLAEEKFCKSDKIREEDPNYEETYQAGLVDMQIALSYFELIYIKHPENHSLILETLEYIYDILRIEEGLEFYGEYRKQLLNEINGKSNLYKEMLLKTYKFK